MAYQEYSLGDVLSGFAQSILVQHEQMRSLERSNNAGAPTITPVGLWWNRTDAPTIGEAIYRWNGSGWTLLMDPEATQINASGTIPYAADQPMGGRKLTGLAAGSAAGHSVRYEQVLLLAGGEMAGDIEMDGNKITDLGAPSDPNDAARKADVDAIGGLGVAVGTFTAPANGTSSTAVALGYQPKAVMIALDQTTIGAAVNHVSSGAVFAGAGAQNAFVYARPSGGGTVLDLALKLTFTATGFTFEIPGSALTTYAGNIRYAAWR